VFLASVSQHPTDSNKLDARKKLTGIQNNTEFLANQRQFLAASRHINPLTPNDL
jgi:hypothetical protein